MSLLLLGLGAAACGGERDLGSLSSLSVTPSVSPSATVAQDKYVAMFPNCQELARKVPNLPPLRYNKDVSAGGYRGVSCEFATPPTGSSVSVELTSWQSVPNDPRLPPEVISGQRAARDRFTNDTDLVNDGAAQDLRLGEQVKWQRPSNNDSCYLTILDGNAVLRFRYSILGGTRLDPKSEQCRGPLRELAKSLYDAVQPH
ncbi:hypothetical protein [Crossiella cryophila]|uniref:DUF3558 domain-containing protein n=1 Tax=Crossiella cryophila TaxID=43355 RepID=A0A7W7CL67_9PSEU|nr:hypothetical protein [Crossiella cryophila]MBB4681841.1 hypothetical protein [Crossiella cryophila]